MGELKNRFFICKFDFLEIYKFTEAVVYQCIGNRKLLLEMKNVGIMVKSCDVLSVDKKAKKTSTYYDYDFLKHWYASSRKRKKDELCQCLIDAPVIDDPVTLVEPVVNLIIPRKKI